MLPFTVPSETMLWPCRCLSDGAFEPVAHAVAGRRYLPFAVEKQLLGLVGEFVVLRTPHDADRRVGRGRQFDPPFRRAACGFRLQFVAGLQRTRVGAAEARAGVDGEAAEHRLAGNAAFDREVAERTAAGKAERQRFAVGEGRRVSDATGAPGDIGIARRARQRDANRAAARREGGAERTDLDAGRERFVADQRIRGRQRQPVHRAARHAGRSAGRRDVRRPVPSLPGRSMAMTSLLMRRSARQ